MKRFLFALLTFVFLAVLLAGPIIVINGCAELPPSEVAANTDAYMQDAKLAILDATKLVNEAAATIDDARAKLPDAEAAATASLAAETAYDEGRYSDAVAELRKALESLGKLDVDVPQEAEAYLKRAQGLLMAAGK